MNYTPETNMAMENPTILIGDTSFIHGCFASVILVFGGRFLSSKYLVGGSMRHPPLKIGKVDELRN